MRQLTFGVDYRYNDLLEDAAYLVDQYPELLKVEVIGKSHDGRDLLLFELGNGKIPVIITSGVHGRESINPMVLVRVIETYLELARNGEPLILDFTLPWRLEDTPTGRLFPGLSETLFLGEGESILNFIIPDGTFMCQGKEQGIPTQYHPKAYLDTFTFYIIPMLNPDGYEIALGGFDMIKDPVLRQNAIQSGIPYEEWKANARGVDLNRNFPSINWKKKFPNDIPGSEKETQALIQLFAEIPAIGYLDLHSRGKAIYYHKSAMSEEYNKEQKEIAERLGAVTGYELMPPELEIEANDTGGNTVHYFSEYYNKPAITIETVEDLAEFPLAKENQRITYEEIALVLLEFVTAIMEQN